MWQNRPGTTIYLFKHSLGKTKDQCVVYLIKMQAITTFKQNCKILYKANVSEIIRLY